MCIFIVTYKDWDCGWRENTGRHRAECHRVYCRLSASHREDQHNCATECTGAQTGDQHLIMERVRICCPQCAAAGRGRGEHPGTTAVQNGTNGATEYHHVGIIGSEEFNNM